MRASSVDQVILETLGNEHAHLTSQQVFGEIRQHLPAVNPSTVYRALERLVYAGKVSVSDMGTGAAVYELVVNEIHHHLVCQKCGKIATLGHEDVERFFGEIEQRYRYEILTNHLILFGICEDCRKNRPSVFPNP